MKFQNENRYRLYECAKVAPERCHAAEMFHPQSCHEDPVALFAQRDRLVSDNANSRYGGQQRHLINGSSLPLLAPTYFWVMIECLSWSEATCSGGHVLGGSL